MMVSVCILKSYFFDRNADNKRSFAIAAKGFVILSVLCFIAEIGHAHVTSKDSTSKFNFSAFGDVYSSYERADPSSNEKPDFIFNHKRNNEVNVNLVLLRAKYDSKHFRSKLSLMGGDYARYNLALEPQWAQFVYEAEAGLLLSSKHRLWLDAGIMQSHIGFESAVSTECLTLSRSILAENSPYYESGIKLSYTDKKEKLNLSILLLNGWQRIRMPLINDKPALGLQVNYKFNAHTEFNYSNFIGNVQPGKRQATRIFNDLYLKFDKKKLSLIAGFDIGSDTYDSSKMGVWYAPVLIAGYKLNRKMRLALRAEYYRDRNQIIVKTGTPNGFQTAGVSLNFDYKISEQMRFRLEGKQFFSRDPIIEGKNNDLIFTSNLSFVF